MTDNPVYRCFVVPTDRDTRIYDAYRMWSNSDHSPGHIVWKGFCEHPDTDLGEEYFMCNGRRVTFSPESNERLLKNWGFGPRSGLSVIVTRCTDDDSCDPEDCYIGTVKGDPEWIVRKLLAIDEQIRSLEKYMGPFPGLNGISNMRGPDGKRIVCARRAEHLSLMPGAGLIYAGNVLEGILCAALFMICLILAVLCIGSGRGPYLTLTMMVFALWINSGYRTTMRLLESGVYSDANSEESRALAMYTLGPLIGGAGDILISGDLTSLLLAIPMAILSVCTIIRIGRCYRYLVAEREKLRICKKDRTPEVSM